MTASKARGKRISQIIAARPFDHVGSSEDRPASCSNTPQTVLVGTEMAPTEIAKDKDATNTTSPTSIAAQSGSTRRARTTRI